MTQALYAHMNNKIKKKRKSLLKMFFPQYFGWFMEGRVIHEKIFRERNFLQAKR
jgi:hypothetical protein